MKKVRPGHRKEGRWIYASVNDITTPKEGRVCMGGRWWAVTDNNEVLFFDGYYSPQCNSNEAIVSRIGCGFGAPPTKPVYIPMAFIPTSD